jgi:hypothetical protein
MSTLTQILDNLQSVIAAAANGTIVTYARSLNDPPEIHKYQRDQLPILFIIEPKHERYKYYPSNRTLTEIDIALYIYFLEGDPETTMGSALANSYIDPVLIGINTNFTLNGYAVNTNVIDKTLVLQNVPLFAWRIQLTIKYEQSATIR